MATNKHYIAAGESLRILTEWDATRRATRSAFIAFAESYGCSALHDLHHGAYSFGGMVAPDDRCPEGWRRKKGKYREEDGRERHGWILVPARSLQVGRDLSDKLRARSTAGTGALMEMLDWTGRQRMISDIFSHPGIRQVGSGEWIITCSEGWPAPKDARPLKTSEYHALLGD